MIDVIVLRLCSLLGMQPELYRCVSCGHEEDTQFEQFSLSAGGIICLNCARERRQDQLLIPCSQAVRQLLTICLFGTFDGVCLAVDEHVYKDVHTIICKFVQFHTDKPLSDWAHLPFLA